MRAISAAILVLAGAIFCLAGLVGAGDAHSFALFAGVLVAFVGLSAWVMEFFFGSSER